jgi:hypothetical protein
MVSEIRGLSATWRTSVNIRLLSCVGSEAIQLHQQGSRRGRLQRRSCFGYSDVIGKSRNRSVTGFLRHRPGPFAIDKRARLERS